MTFKSRFIVRSASVPTARNFGSKVGGRCRANAIAIPLHGRPRESLRSPAKGGVRQAVDSFLSGCPNFRIYNRVTQLLPLLAVSARLVVSGGHVPVHARPSRTWTRAAVLVDTSVGALMQRTNLVQALDAGDAL